MWLPESIGFYCHYYTWLLCTSGKTKLIFFLFVSSLSLLGMKWKMSLRYTGHYVVWNKDIPKRGEKNVVKHHIAFGKLFLHYPLQVLTNLRYLNSDIWKWIIIICNLSTKLKQKKWHIPGRYTMCRSHSWKTIFSLHHNKQLSKF